MQVYVCFSVLPFLAKTIFYTTKCIIFAVKFYSLIGLEMIKTPVLI